MHLDDLPSEIRGVVALLLDDSSKRALRTVSTTWFNIIKYDKFYITSELNTDDIQRFFKGVAKLKWLVDLNLSSVRYKGRDIIWNLTRISNLRSITIPQGYPSKEEMMELTHLGRNLEYWDFPPNYTPIELYHHFTNIKSLELKEESTHLAEITKNMSRLEKLDLPLYNDNKTWPFERIQYPHQLTSLEMAINSSSQETNHSERFSITRIYNLKAFVCTLKNNVADENNTQMPPLNMLTSLQSLKLQCFKVPLVAPRIDSNSQLTQLSLNAPLGTCSELWNSLHYLTSLKDLSIALAKEATFEQFSFLTAMANLVRFNVTGTQSDYSKLFQFVMSTKLISLSIGIQFDPRHITHLTSLKQLGIAANSQKNFASLQYLPNIENFNIYIRSIATDVDLSGLEYWTRLKTLSFYIEDAKQQQIHFPNMERVESLQSITITAGSIDQEFMNSLKNCTYLSTLSLTSHSESNLNFNFLEKLPVTSVFCWNVNYLENDWSSFIKLTRLVRLFLPCIYNDDHILDLTVLSDLRTLGFNSASPKCKGLYFTRLTQLTSLKLSGNRVANK